MAESKNILFVVSVNSEYHVQLALAKLLRERSSLHPVFCFDSVAHNLYKEVQMCKNEGFTVNEFTKSYNYKDGRKFIMTYHQHTNRSNYNKSFWKDLQDLLLLVIKVRKLLRHYTRIIWLFRQNLKRNRFLLLVVSNNKYSFNNPYFIKAAHMEGIQVISLPFGMPTPHTLATILVKEKKLNLNRPVNKLASFLFPKWKYQKNHLNLLALPAEFLIVMELLDAAPELPWSGNGGRADFILTESTYMKNHYLQQGIKEEKLVLTGALYNDVLTYVLKERKQYYNEFCLKHELDPNKPMVLTSLPLYLETFMDRALEFASYEDFVNFYVECLVKINIHFNIAVSIHPRMYPEHISGLNYPGIIISDERLEHLMPLCKFYINCGSTTTRWAIACTKPVINYDFYRLNSDIFTVKEGVVTVNTPEEFQKVLHLMSCDNKYYQDLRQRQEELRSHYGLLDGRVGERMLNFFERLIPNNSIDS